MKTVINVMVLVLLVFGCKKSEDSVSFSNISLLEGKWQLIEIETGALSGLVWNSIDSTQKQNIFFRADGIMVDSIGLPACCAPQAYIINDRLFEINRLVNIPDNPACNAVKCGFCKFYDLEIQGQVMILTPCQGPRRKYLRR